MPTLHTYCLHWHLSSSPAFQDLTSIPLAGRVHFRFIGWDGHNLPPLAPAADETGAAPAVFCQLPPPHALRQSRDARLVWIPMWDESARRSAAWWASLPKTLRIVAFSHAVAERARTAGLPTLELTCFRNPHDYPAASWSNGPVLLYWNRCGLYTPRFLARMCDRLRATTLLYRNKIDPGLAQACAHPLPAQFGRTRVVNLPAQMSHAEYLDCLGRANVVLAPRPREGVGMVALEAMASGCAVFAIDAPATNEYIDSGKDGYLFRLHARCFSRHRVLAAIRWRLRRLTLHGGRKPVPFQATMDQDWRAIGRLDLQTIGDAARQKQAQGWRVWQKSLATYAAFLTEWP
jgi:hypothetical protein